MGICSATQKEELESIRDSDGEVRLLIVALNYKYIKDAELTCTKDAKTMFRIADRAGVGDVTVVTDKGGLEQPNKFPTRAAVLHHIQVVSGHCRPGDWFVWFYAGHGVNVTDYTGKEQTGFDQAFVTPNLKGKMTESACLIDDDFALALDTFVPLGVKILCINDCCHSGTICDIDSFDYIHDIYQISASQDDQEADDTGRGGALSVALRRSIRALSLKYGENEFSIRDVFDRCKRSTWWITREQDLSLQWSGQDPSLVAWPFCYAWWEYINSPDLVVNIYEKDDLGEESDSSDS